MLEVSLQLPRVIQPHLQQLLVGFNRLKRRKIVRLEIDSAPANDPGNSYILRATLNRQWRIVYDENDGYNFYCDGKNVYREFINRQLESADFYFKRTCRTSWNAVLTSPEKILPLGMNVGYTVPSFTNWAQFLLKRLLRRGSGPVWPEVIESLPTFNRNPSVIFLTRAWDPAELDEFPDERNAFDVRLERDRINALRADCIRTCRKAFGSQFIGGFAHDDYARKLFPDCLIADPAMSLRSCYLERMKTAAIGIATSGLHGSIGWKTAEYVAAARAIVSEPLGAEVPGVFEKGDNYLEFDSVEGCVAAVEELFHNHDLRFRMMKNNFAYYRLHLEPSQLVLNSLILILERSHSLVNRE
jgi:hypothetical protein